MQREGPKMAMKERHTRNYRGGGFPGSIRLNRSSQSQKKKTPEGNGTKKGKNGEMKGNRKTQGKGKTSTSVHFYQKGEVTVKAIMKYSKPNKEKGAQVRLEN